MEIPAWMFFSFSAITGVTFLKLGFDVMDKTDLSDSVSPTIMSLFKHSLAISICHSSYYTLIFRPLSPIPVFKYSSMMILSFVLLFYRTAGESFAWNSLIYYVIHFFVLLFHPIMNNFFHKYYFFVGVAFLIPLLYSTGSDSLEWYLTICLCINLSVVVPETDLAFVFKDKISLSIYFTVESALFLVGGKTKLFPPMLVLFISFFTSASWAIVSGDERLQTIIEENRIFTILCKNKKVKFIEFAVGMAGTILFQNFFRLTSLDHVLAFVYLTVAWLANLVLLCASFDFGIFNFLLSNVVVGCTVSQFGLGRATWHVYGASLLLYGLRLKLESLSLVKRGDCWIVK